MLLIRHKTVSGDAFSSQDQRSFSSQDRHYSVMGYRPLLQLVRDGRQDNRFNRHTAVPVYHDEDNYGRSNEITSPKLSAVPHVTPVYQKDNYGRVNEIAHPKLSAVHQVAPVYQEDDYGRTNEITSSQLSALPQGRLFILQSKKNCRSST